ncbi:MAG TPA: PKD domain-containing protein [Solirubrobacteraceae bacterium]|nr:PKD domain-containing protein [Solirubrobacteraceae bacterium]
MRVLPTAVSAFLLLALPAAAPAATTANFSFQHGEANYRTFDGPIAFEQYGGGTRMSPCPPPGAPTCSYEAHEFEIAPGEVNGKILITLTWANAENDWDLYLYRVQDDGSVDETDPIASAASFGDTDEVATLISREEPIPAGTYRIYVDNWQNADVDYDWQAAVAFEGWFPPNDPPTAALAAPPTAVGGQPVTLDASGSKDDKGIVNYSWDLDGDGRVETDAGSSPVHQATFAPGRRHIALRVRDEEGRSAFAAHTIDVAPAPAGPPVVPPTTTEFVLPPAPGRIALDLDSPQRLDGVLARGVRATIECPSSCAIRATLRISAATARRLGLGRRAMTIARRTREQSGRSFPRIRLKPPLRVRRAMRGEESIPATVRITVTAEGFSPQRYTRPVELVD